MSFRHLHSQLPNIPRMARVSSTSSLLHSSAYPFDLLFDFPFLDRVAFHFYSFALALEGVIRSALIILLTQSHYQKQVIVS